MPVPVTNDALFSRRGADVAVTEEASDAAASGHTILRARPSTAKPMAKLRTVTGRATCHFVDTSILAGVDNEERSDSRRKGGRARFTHFLSVPFNTADIREKFDQIKSEILAKYTGDDQLSITEELFQNPAKIHLTFGIMVSCFVVTARFNIELLSEPRE